MIAAFIAFVIKSLEREEKSALEDLFVRYVNSELVARKKEEGQHREEEHDSETDEDEHERVAIKKRKEKIAKPPSARKLEKQRQKRLLEIRMYKEIRDVFFMLLFTFLVYYMGLEMHDDHAFRQTQNIRELLKVSIRPMSKAMFNIQSVDSFLKVI